MKCEVVQEKLSCYLDGVVDEATMEMIEDHLDGCSECRAELSALQALTASMGSCEVEPPFSLRSAIHAAIDRQPVVSEECETVLALLSEMVDGELGDEDCGAALRHMASCGACAHEYTMLQRMVSAVASVGELEPPLKLKSRIVAAIAGEKKVASPLAGLVQKARQILQPAGSKWIAGTAVAATLAAIIVSPSLRQSDVVTVSERPEARLDVRSVPSASAEMSAAAPEGSVAAPVITESIPRNVAVARRQPPNEMMRVDRRPEQPSPASPDRAQPNGEPTPAVTARVTHTAPVTPAVATSVAAPDVPAAQKEIAPPPAAVTAAASEENSNKEIAAAADAKPAEVRVAAQEPIVAPQDDRAMIRSLKQQMQMKKKFEEVSVDFLDMRF